MSSSHEIQGIMQRWKLLETKLGGGYSGETFLVCSENGQDGICKRPSQNSLAGEARRQAGDITREAEILRNLNDVTYRFNGYSIRAIRLLDQSQPNLDAEKTFIIQEKAPGISLKVILDSTSGDVSESPESLFAKSPEMLRSVVVASALGVLGFLRSIHGRNPGVMWNDVQAAHIFWNPEHKELVLIDWGNGHFLNDDRSTDDGGKFFTTDDFKGYFQKFREILSKADPNLPKTIGWPSTLPQRDQLDKKIGLLKNELENILLEEERRIEKICQELRDICFTENPGIDELSKVDNLKNSLVAIVNPEFTRYITRLCERVVQNLARERNFTDLHTACRKAGVLTGQNDIWDWIINLIPHFRHKSSQLDNFAEIVDLVLRSQWAGVHWQLRMAFRDADQKSRDARDILIKQVRGFAGFKASPLDGVTAYLDGIRKLMDGMNKDDVLDDPEKYRAIKRLVEDLQCVIDEWNKPGDVNLQNILSYNLFENKLYPPPSGVLPLDASQPYRRTIDTLQDAVNDVKKAWNSGDLEQMEASVQDLFLFDYQRQRLLIAGHLIQQARVWRENGKQVMSGSTDPVQMLQIAQNLKDAIGHSAWLSQQSKPYEDIIQQEKEKQNHERERREREAAESRRRKEEDDRRRMADVNYGQNNKPSNHGVSQPTTGNLLQGKGTDDSGFFALIKEGRLDAADEDAKQYLGQEKYLNVVKLFRLAFEPGDLPLIEYPGFYFGEGKKAEDILKTLFSWRKELKEHGINAAKRKLSNVQNVDWQSLKQAHQLHDAWRTYQEYFDLLRSSFNQSPEQDRPIKLSDLHDQGIGEEVINHIKNAREIFFKLKNKPNHRKENEILVHLRSAKAGIDTLRTNLDKNPAVTPVRRDFLLLKDAYDWEEILAKLERMIRRIDQLQKIQPKDQQRSAIVVQLESEFSVFSPSQQNPEMHGTQENSNDSPVASAIEMLLAAVLVSFLFCCVVIVYGPISFFKQMQYPSTPTLIEEQSTVLPEPSASPNVDGLSAQQRIELQNWLNSPPSDIQARAEALQNLLFEPLKIDAPTPWDSIEKSDLYLQWLRVTQSICALQAENIKVIDESKKILNIYLPNHIAMYQDGEKVFDGLCQTNSSNFISNIAISATEPFDLLALDLMWTDGCARQDRASRTPFLTLTPGAACELKGSALIPNSRSVGGINVDVCMARSDTIPRNLTLIWKSGNSSAHLKIDTSIIEICSTSMRSNLRFLRAGDLVFGQVNNRLVDGLPFLMPDADSLDSPLIGWTITGGIQEFEVDVFQLWVTH